MHSFLPENRTLVSVNEIDDKKAVYYYTYLHIVRYRPLVVGNISTGVLENTSKSSYGGSWSEWKGQTNTGLSCVHKVNVNLFKI